MGKEKRIAIVMQHWAGYLYGVQLGISEYLRLRPEWIWQHFIPGDSAMEILEEIRIDGILSYAEEPYIGWLKRLGAPVVDISAWVDVDSLPRVLPDDKAIGKMAADYLVHLGLRHFGVFGPNFGHFSEVRCRSFCKAIALDEGNCSYVWDYVPEKNPGLRKSWINPHIRAWLESLPKPAGIFVTHDNAASELMSVCRYMGIRIPEDVCVLGVDNDELITRMCNPPLSSIALPSRKIGFAAADLLHRLIQGEPAPEEPVYLPPVGVVSRQSTNLLAIEDEDVRSAVHYIQKNVHERVTVEDVLRVVPVNRRYLERKFRKHLGRSPLQEIQRTRLERAKELLRFTDSSIATVARRSGFMNSERLANVFQKIVGETPTGYRKRVAMTLYELTD